MQTEYGVVCFEDARREKRSWSACKASKRFGPSIVPGRLTRHRQRAQRLAVTISCLCAMNIVSRSSVFFPNVARHIRQSAILACAPRPPKKFLGEQFRSVSRFPERIGRLPRRRAIPRRLQEESGKSHPLEYHPTIEGSPLWASSSSVEIRGDPTEGLKRLLSHDVLVITRYRTCSFAFESTD